MGSSRAVALTVVVSLVTCAGLDTRARADRRISRPRRAAAIAAAIFPGVLVHGIGSYLVGERRAAKRLALTGLVGTAALGVVGRTIAWSGGSEVTLPGVPILLVGAGLSIPTWFADLAVAAGASRTGRARAPAPWSLELGTTWLHDAYRERGMANLAATLEVGDHLGLAATALIDAEGGQHTEALTARWRLLGAAPTGEAIAHGDRVLASITGRHHRDDDDRLAIDTAEISVAGRLDLDHLDPALAGQFLEVSSGLGVQRASFTHDAHDAHDTTSILTGGFAYGLYLGAGTEVAVSYEHRRDGIVGGIAAWRAAGFVGSVGASALVRIAPRWRVHGELQIGNAWVTTLGLRYEGTK